MPHTAPDPLMAMLYVACFVIAALFAMRRPAFGICALIAVIPFAFYSDLAHTTITLPKVVLIGVLLGIASHPDAFAVLGARPARRMLGAGCIVLAATLLSFVHAAYHAPVIREALKMVEYLLLFSVVVAAYRLDPDRRALRITFYVVTILVCLLALSQEVLGSPSGLYVNGHPIPRIAGPLEGPNQLAGYLDIALPLVLALALDEMSALAGIALFFIVVADILTFSRGGEVGALVALAVVLFRVRSNLRAIVLPICSGLIAGLLVAVSWRLFAHAAGVLRSFSLTPSNYAGGVGTRPELWHAAIALWERHPLFGVGAGNFERDIPLTGLRGVRTHANSLYLQSLVEGGIPLIAATLWLTYTSIALFARDRLRSPFVTAAFAGSIAIAVHQIVDFLTFYPKVGEEWWIVLALGVAELTVVRAAAVCA